LELLIPPAGILAAINYYQKGYVDLKTAAIICIGFVLGGYLGSITAIHISPVIIRKIFAVTMVLLAIKMFLYH